MAVPKKRTSISKKHIRNNFWKKGGYWAALKAFSIVKSLYSGNSTLVIEKKTEKNLRRIGTIEIRTKKFDRPPKNFNIRKIEKKTEKNLRRIGTIEIRTKKFDRPPKKFNIRKLER